MPYSSVEEVVKRFPKLKKYPKEAQAMFLKVVNAALKQYPGEEGKAIATAWSAINKKYGRRDEEMRFVTAQFNFDMAPLHEFDGILTVPTIFTKEGVQNKGFKPWSELRSAAPSLEGRPVIFQHPPENRPVDPNVDSVIGKTAHVIAREDDHVLHGDTVIQISEAPEWFIQELKQARAREGSVGYWSVSEYVTGSFKGDSYDRIERNIIFDHYAVGIPRGACSIAEGCGLGFDESQDHHGGDDEMSINLDEFEGERRVSLTKLKEFLMDIFRHNYSKASEGTAWNFRAADYTLAQLKRASAVITGAGDKKEDCHLPHHKPDGTLVWRGVAAAGAVLQGARGGVNISAADKAKAKRHLARHYGEFDKEPPWTKGDEGMRMNEEEKTAYEKKIGDLTAEKLALETEKAGLEQEKTALEREKTTWETEKATLTEERDTLKTWKEENEPKLQGYVEAEQTATEKQRDELLIKIGKATGEEDAEAVKEKYKDWSVEQLTHFEETLVKSTDRSALAPPTVGPDGKPVAATKPSVEVRGKELTVGSLFGKKAGE